MTNIIELTDNVIGVRVPSDARDFRVCNGPNYWVHYLCEIEYPGAGDLYMGKPVLIEIPEGNWKIIAISTEITEEQAKGIVLKIKFGRMDLFKNYTANNCRDFRDIVEVSFDTALESFRSLLKSKGIQEPVLILKRER